MINEERIRLMTRMASYADTEGKRNESIASYFRSDYVGMQVLKAVICATIAYMIAFAVYIYYDFETFMINIYKMDLWDFAAKALKNYVIFTIVYCVLVYIGFTVRYAGAKKGMRRYFNNLRLLGSMYSGREIQIK
ncbi:MAG: hypothetical protein ILP13_04115 [Lachnospiraceae bacterium]|nr:hypothetical protein [Lachnospiraceae bacterium]